MLNITMLAATLRRRIYINKLKMEVQPTYSSSLLGTFSDTLNITKRPTNPTRKFAIVLFS